MNTLQLLTLTLTLLLRVCAVHGYAYACAEGQTPVSVDFLVAASDDTNNVYRDLHHDAARTFLDVYVDNQKIDTLHGDANGVFHICYETAARLRLVVRSLDLAFQVSNQFDLYTELSADGNDDDNNNNNNNAADTLVLKQYVPGLHEKLHTQLASVRVPISQAPTLVIDGHVFRVGLQRYEASDDGGWAAAKVFLANTIPGMSIIMNNKWLRYTMCAMVIVAVLPWILTTLDPEFAERVVEAQKEAQKDAMEKKQQEEKSG